MLQLIVFVYCVSLLWCISYYRETYTE